MFHKSKKFIKYAVIAVIVINFLFASFAPSLHAGSSVELAYSLEILPVAEVSTVPSGEARIPGNSRPGLVIYPYTEKEIIVSGEEKYAPYVKVLMVSGVPVVEGMWFQTKSREPEIRGKTNLKNAIIFIEIDNIPDKIFITFADSVGNWRIYSPYYFGLGNHVLNIAAMSQVNPYFQANTFFHFEVIPIEAPVVEQPAPSPSPAPTIPPRPYMPPVIIPIPTPSPIIPRPPVYPEAPMYPPREVIPLIPSTPEKPGEPESKAPAIPKKPMAQIYAPNIEVLPESKSIMGGDEVEMRIELRNPAAEEEQEVALKIRVYGPDNAIVYEKIEKIQMKDAAEMRKKYRAPLFARPGKYTVSVETEADGKTYVSFDTFEVKEREGVAKITALLDLKNIHGNVARAMMIFLVIFLSFIILFVREYRHSKNFLRVRDEDMKDRGLLR